MAKPRRSARPPASNVPAATATVDKSVARPNVSPTRPKRRASNDAPSTPSFWQTFVRSYLPIVVVTAVAYAAVAYGFTTAPAYIRSKPLMVVFRRAFIALVCLSNRCQLQDLYYPRHKPLTLRRLAWGQFKSLFVVILANCAGTTIIQPLLNQPPAYAKTIELVVPVYIAVEVAVGVARVPTPLIQFIIGFLVSWLKAATTSTLVLKWQEDDGAHPLALVVICTCNLFASGLVLRMLWSLVQTLATGGFVGLLAFVANHFSTKEERQVEATVLYFLVAWFAFDKYWKAPLRAALVHCLTTDSTKIKAKTT